MKQILCYSTLLFMGMPAWSQHLLHPGGVATAPVNCYSRLQADAFSFLVNAASMVSLQNTAGAVSGERRFLLEELGSFSAGFVFPGKNSRFAAGGGYAGSPAYRESRLTMAYAHEMGAHGAAGISFSYFHHSSAGYTPASGVSTAIAAILRATPSFTTGVQLFNPRFIAFGDTPGDLLPMIISLGGGYDISPALFLGVEMQKAGNVPVEFRGGIQYRAADAFVVRAGVGSGNNSVYLGSGFYIRGIRVDCIAAFHPLLGITPVTSIFYNGKE